jgi:trigger factor
MKVDIERINSTERKLAISVPVEQVDSNFTEIIADFRKSASVKGFRQGKTPVSVIESMYGKQIAAEVTSKIVNDTFYKILEENRLVPVNKPRLEPEELKKGSEFNYTAEFEVVPDFEAEGYVGLELTKEKREVTEEEVQKALDRLRENAAEAVPLTRDRKVKKGDYVFIDQQGFVDGNPLKDLKKENLQLLVGQEKLIEDFEKNLIGMKKGEEKEFTISYGQDFVIKEAAGKEVNFKVKLNDVKERVLPELDDEFAKQYELQNLEELKKRIEEDLEKQLEDQADGKLRQDILKKLLAKYKFDIPQSLLDQEKNFLINRFANDYQSRGLEVPEISEDVLSNIDKRSETNVKASIILGKIADEEDIFVSQAEVDNTLAEMAAMYRIPFDQFRQTYEKNNMLQGLESRLTEQKVLDFIIEKSKIKEKKAAKNEIDINSEN